jgi:hypothetical protein
MLIDDERHLSTFTKLKRKKNNHRWVDVWVLPVHSGHSPVVRSSKFNTLFDIKLSKSALNEKYG